MTEVNASTDAMMTEMLQRRHATVPEVSSIIFMITSVSNTSIFSQAARVIHFLNNIVSDFNTVVSIAVQLLTDKPSQNGGHI